MVELSDHKGWKTIDFGRMDFEPVHTQPIASFPVKIIDNSKAFCALEYCISMGYAELYRSLTGSSVLMAFSAVLCSYNLSTLTGEENKQTGDTFVCQ